jgi:hypothetical protein
MRQGALSVSGLVLAVALGITSVIGGALAQGTPPPPAAAAPPPPQEPVKQVELTEKKIQSFITVQKDMAPLVQKAQVLPAGQQDAKLEAEFETVAKKHGFADYGELGDVGANIMLILDGIDPSTGKFTDPITAIKKEIDEIQADKQMPEKEKKDAVAERTAALKSFEPVKFPANVELVVKMREKIEAALQ